MGPAEIRACRQNRLLWGMQLLYQLPLGGDSGSLCPSPSFVPSPAVIAKAKSLSLCFFPHATEKKKTLVVGGTLKFCFWQRLLLLQGQAE